MTKKLHELFAYKHKVYSIGYQGRNIEDFLKILKEKRIKVLIDTRKSGLSRKPGFSRHVLKKKVEEKGIKFIAVPDVGSPKEFRDYLNNTGNINRFFEMYRRHIVRNKLFDKLSSRINRERACIMCFEKSPYECHRLVLSDMLDENIGAKVEHL